METEEVIVGVVLPIATNVPAAGNSTFEFVRPFKQARRREGDASIVTAGMRVTLEPGDGKWLVKEAALCFGGMATSTVGAPLTEVRNLFCRCSRRKGEIPRFWRPYLATCVLAVRKLGPYNSAACLVSLDAISR